MIIGEDKDCTFCNDCGKKQSCCNSSCFVDDESNIFKNLVEDELNLLVEKKQQIKYKTGETIIKQNTASTYVICIKEGLAKIYIEGEKGKNLIVKIIGKGDFITGGGLFNGNVHHFTISAITPVWAIRRFFLIAPSFKPPTMAIGLGTLLIRKSIPPSRCCLSPILA